MHEQSNAQIQFDPITPTVFHRHHLSAAMLIVSLCGKQRYPN